MGDRWKTDGFATTVWSFSLASGVSFSHGIEVSTSCLVEIFFAVEAVVFFPMFFLVDGFVSAQVKEQLNSRQIPKAGMYVSLRKIECLGMLDWLVYKGIPSSSSVFSTD